MLMPTFRGSPWQSQARVFSRMNAHNSSVGANHSLCWRMPWNRS
jgi:hypothetical protein